MLRTCEEYRKIWAYYANTPPRSLRMYIWHLRDAAARRLPRASVQGLVLERYSCRRILRASQGIPHRMPVGTACRSGDLTVSQAAPRLALSAAPQPRWLPRHLHDRYDIKETQYTNL